MGRRKRLDAADLLAGIVALLAIAAIIAGILYAIEHQPDPETPGVNRAEIIDNMKGARR